MIAAYADPPYPGQAKRIYGDHPDYAGEVDHVELIARLERDYPDGWALSTSVPALGYVLSLCPAATPTRKNRGRVLAGTGVRVCAWHRARIPFGDMRLMWAWEPVILRSPQWRRRHERDYVPDSLYAAQPSGFLAGQITGQKPLDFCHWLFRLLALGPDDELVDLYPGSGAVGQAWAAYRSQLQLAV